MKVIALFFEVLEVFFLGVAWYLIGYTLGILFVTAVAFAAFLAVLGFLLALATIV